MKPKTVVITGCTRGLGRAMVPAFIDAGWQVVGCGRDQSQIAMLRQQVTTRMPTSGPGAPCHFSSSSAARTMAAR
ncbi:MAG: SDR family NAD(P)-dependent oxidoreductase [Verrucomicrobiota bacterium]